MIRNGKLALMTTFAAGLSLAGSTDSYAASFTRLRNIPGGGSGGYGNAVSGNGLVAVGASETLTGLDASRWTSSVRVGLGDLAGGSDSSWASDVSDDGSVIVGRGGSSSGSEAFRWTPSGGMVGLGDLAGGIFNSEAMGVSGDGSTVVGNSRSSAGTEAFRWTTDEGMVGLGDFSGGPFLSGATGVSGDGTVVVGSGYSSSGTEAFRWTSNEGWSAWVTSRVDYSAALRMPCRLMARRSLVSAAVSSAAKLFAGRPNGDGWIGSLSG